MANYLTTDIDLAIVANAIRTRGGTSEQLEFPLGFVSAIQAISSDSGINVTNGVIVKEVDGNERIIEVEKYGDCNPFEFGTNSSGYRDFVYGYLDKVTLHDCTKLADRAFANRFITQIVGLNSITECGYACFMNAGLPSITLPSATSVGGNCFRGLHSTCLSVSLPVLETAGQYLFQQSTGLQSVQIGSIGHAAPISLTNPFYGCTQSGLTIVGYQTGANADALIANYRNGATNATIIIKASENTSYGGQSFVAGDTIVTSTS